MTAHGVRLGPTGLEVVRRAPPEDPERLRAAVDALRMARGAGVVELLDVDDSARCLVVRMAYAGLPPRPPLRPDEVRRVGAQLAATLSDLHSRGMTHGAVAREHVLVHTDGQTRLCGFGASGSGTPADDVAALGSLLLELIDARDRSAAAEEIRAIAARCCATILDVRPTASAVAAALAAAGEPRRSIAKVKTPRRALPAKVKLVPIACALAVAVVTFAWRASPQTDAARVSIASTTSTTAEPTTSTSTVVTRRVWPREEIAIVDGPGGRWSFDQAGDVVSADVDCDGIDTPAVLRRDGALFVVDEWPADADAVTSRYIETFDDAIDLEVESSGPCDELVVVTSRGAIKPVLRPEA